MPEANGRIRVIDAIPELAEQLAPDARELARRHVLAPVIELRPGRWSTQSTDIGREAGQLGLVIVDGLMTRDVRLGETVACELVGHGDLLRPLDHDGDGAPIPFAVDWTVLEPARLAILDRQTTQVVGRFPELMDALMLQAIKRAHSLGLYLAVGHMRRLEPRIEVIMWHLADRWGRVTPEGVLVPLQLTHRTLARLVGAQRPSVTTAVNRLASSGVLSRRDDGSWMLHGDPPEALERREHAAAAT